MTDYQILQRAQDRRKKAIDLLWKAKNRRAELRLEGRINRIDAHIRKILKRVK